MAQVARYQPQRLFAEHEAVKTFHGLDPLTGLPVLIYKFALRPTVKVGELKSEAIPAILTSSFENGRGQLVVAYARGYEPLRESVQAHEVVGLLRDSAAALYDAARSSIIHGDLRPERFLKANGHVMVEGYGVPWAAWNAVSEFSAPERIGGASAPSDVFSWARSVQFLAGKHLPGEVRGLLEACLDADPKKRPNAEVIYKQIVEPPKVVEKASPFDNLDFSKSEGERFAQNPFTLGQPALQREERVASENTEGTFTPRRASRKVTAYQERSQPSQARPTETKPDAAADDPFGFGSVDERPLHRGSRGRRAILLTALLIGLLVLGALALFNRNVIGAALGIGTLTDTVNTGIETSVGTDGGIGSSISAALVGLTNLVTGADTTQSGSYLVNVEVVPANVRAELFVVESPAGSSLPLERPVSVVPGSAVLDRTGVWRLQAQVEGRRSEVKEVRVPDERSVVFNVPWVPAAAQNAEGGTRALQPLPPPP